VDVKDLVQPWLVIYDLGL